MSLVKVQGNASGTGIFTIASPNSNTDRTLTLPDNTGTILTTATPGVPVNGPAFNATASATQSIAVNTIVKVAIDTEYFDTNGNYNTSLYRFTPTVAGYYQFNGTVSAQTTASTYGVHAVLYKNGGTNTLGNTSLAAAYNYPYSTVSTATYMNGSTDYMELYVNTFGPSGSLTCIGNVFSAALIRSAT
jgi:hypothetical protein